MEKEFLRVSDETFTLTETKDKNKFYFFRNDRGVLTADYSEPLEFYHAYIVHKMRNGEIKGPVRGNIRVEISEDKKLMRLIISDFTETQETVTQNQPENFWKRLLHKIFG